MTPAARVQVGKTPPENPADDQRARYVAIFFDGIRSSCARPEHFGWTREETERVLASCTRIEQLGLPAAWSVLNLWCAGRQPLLAVSEAVETPVTRGQL